MGVCVFVAVSERRSSDDLDEEAKTEATAQAAQQTSQG
jgi:hypothetical protein